MAQINKPTDYFNTKLYTGNGSTQSITGVGFQPDWVWTKQRNTARGHFLIDAVRGVTKYISSHSTDEEFDSGSSGLTSFDSDGYSIGSSNLVNESSGTYASWNWYTGATASSNTDGSITSTVSANTTAGFSIVSYTGTGSNATVGHGLGSVPAMIILKNRSASNGWIVYHHKNTSAPETDYLELHSTNATNDLNTIMNDTAPTSSVFTVGTEGAVNNSGNNFIAYCFAEKKGYSKFGSYIGNGNANGAFVYTGFKPAFVMIKATSAGNAQAWLMFDNKRPGYNLVDYFLEADASGAEAVNNPNQRIDILSNGFKLRSSSGGINLGANNYIYMAFAEQPLVGTNNIPCTAR